MPKKSNHVNMRFHVDVVDRLMKRALLFLAAVLFACPASAETLRLTDGREFIDYRITTDYPAHVMVRHKGGAAKIEKKLLPPDVLAKHPVAASEEPKPPALEAKKTVVHVADFGLRSTDADEDYTHYSWNAEIKNPTTLAATFRLQLRMYDGQKFLLETDRIYDAHAPAGKSATYSGKSVMKSSLWKQVKTFSVVMETD